MLNPNITKTWELEINSLKEKISQLEKENTKLKEEFAIANESLELACLNTPCVSWGFQNIESAINHYKERAKEKIKND